MNESVRLSKRLIETIGCSRSEAEKYIEGGWVLVDGKVIDEPQFKVQDQTVALHPDATLTPVEPVTLLLHLATEFDSHTLSLAQALITPATHVKDDSAGIRLLKRHFTRLMPTMPLETGASGLLVYTQDKRVVRRLVEDADKIEQEYIVEVSGEIATDGIDTLNRTLRRNGLPLSPAKVSWQNENRLRFALKNMRPGQIEYMCNHVGLTIVAMKRIRIGRVPMAKLPPGQWRYLPPGMLF